MADKFIASQIDLLTRVRLMNVGIIMETDQLKQVLTFTREEWNAYKATFLHRLDELIRRCSMDPNDEIHRGVQENLIHLKNRLVEQTKVIKTVDSMVDPTMIIAPGGFLSLRYGNVGVLLRTMPSTAQPYINAVRSGESSVAFQKWFTICHQRSSKRIPMSRSTVDSWLVKHRIPSEIHSLVKHWIANGLMCDGLTPAVVVQSKLIGSTLVTGYLLNPRLKVYKRHAWVVTSDGIVVDADTSCIPGHRRARPEAVKTSRHYSSTLPDGYISYATTWNDHEWEEGLMSAVQTSDYISKIPSVWIEN